MTRDGRQVDRLYFINLDSRQDRLEHMTRQLRPCPWPVERIAAVRLERSPQELGIPVRPRLVGQWHFVGIWMSHRAALQSASQTGSDGAFVVLEDDVRIDPRFWSERLALHPDLPDDWEIVLLSPRHRRRERPRPPGAPGAKVGKKWIRDPFDGAPTCLGEVRPHYVTTGAHFTIFRNRQVVRKVMRRMDSCTALYDVDAFYIDRFQTYGIHNQYVSTAHLGSDHN